ncbi:MAG TPA: type II/IV secretion system ATPase subunit [Candidatus Baltobacteraceae bacterium]|nr:type II/IV secretion system ATPase subunit [Candidatus Baltobacteraceae bacterium]
MMHKLSVLLSRRRKGDTWEQADAPSPGLSFGITNDYPTEVSEERPAMFALLGRRGHQLMYSISAFRLCVSDLRALRRCKRQMVEVLRTQQPQHYSKEAIMSASALALSMLQGIETKEGKELLAYILAHETVGYGPISMLIDNHAEIEEIVINSTDANIGIYHATYGYCTTNLRFSGEREFRYVVNKLIACAERELNTANPVIDAQLVDGSRIHAQLKPYSLNGPIASIRLNGGKRMDIRKLMQLKTVSPELLAYLWMAIDANLNIVVSGAPASGKTSLLMALHALVPRTQRVIAIEEDVNELKYGSFMNVVSLQGSSLLGRVSLRDQIINSLHLRPDRLIVGEIRGGETKEVLSGSNLGIPFMTTMHSSGSGQPLIDRLRSRPMSVEEQLISMLDVSVFMKQRDIKSRVAEQITEYLWLSRAEIKVEEATALGREYRLTEIAKNGSLDLSLLHGSKVVFAYASARMVTHGIALKELKKRATFLKALLESDAKTDVDDYIGKFGEIR